MEEQNLSLQITKSEISLQLSALGYNYQKLLQEAENITFDKNSLSQDYAPLKELRNLLTTIKNVENPYTEKWKAFNESKKSISDPVEEILKRKNAEFTKLANELSLEKQKTEAENTRIKQTKEYIKSQTLSFSTQIANATTLNELVIIEKKIGSEKSRTLTYKEFLGDAIDSFNTLVPLIKEQKKRIEQLNELNQKEKQLQDSGNDSDLLEVMQKKDLLNIQIKDTALEVQHKALELSNTDTEVIQETQKEIKARRTTWEYEVIDIKEIQKKMPHLVNLVLDTSKVDDWLRSKRADGTLKEETIHGLKIFQKKYY